MFVCFHTLRLFLSSHKNKIRETELEEKFTDTLNVIEVVSVVETYQSDENNLTYKTLTVLEQTSLCSSDYR